MSHTDGCPAGRSQLLTLSRRELLQGLALVVLPSLTCPLPPLHPRPKFSIGDKILNYWVDEMTGELRSEQGEVVGTCWHPKNQQWEYLIDWDSSIIFDGQLTDSKNLELNHA